MFNVQLQPSGGWMTFPINFNKNNTFYRNDLTNFALTYFLPFFLLVGSVSFFSHNFTLMSSLRKHQLVQNSTLFKEIEFLTKLNDLFFFNKDTKASAFFLHNFLNLSFINHILLFVHIGLKWEIFIRSIIFIEQIYS